MELFFIFVVSSLSIVSATEHAVVGNSFQYVISRGEFTFQNLESSSPISFRPSVNGMAGLPSWLNYYQRNTTHDGFLYGTAAEADVGLTILEIIALNRDTYITVRKELIIDVQDNPDAAKFLAVFNVTNRNLAEMLMPDEQTAFKTIVDQTVWLGAEDLVIYSVASGGKRINSLDQLHHKEGVVVTVGSSSFFPAELMDGYNTSQCNITGSGGSSVSQITSWSESFIEKNYFIDWCYFDLIIIEEATAVSPVRLDLGGDYDAPIYNPGRLENLRKMFYLMVIVPIAAAILFAIVLGYAMLCRREGVLKRNVNTPEEQLIHHKNIKKSTKDLRKMSNRRNNPGMVFPPYTGSPNSIYQPRYRSRTSEEEPLTSSQAANPEASPPVYRLPPLQTDRHETSFINI